MVEHVALRVSATLMSGASMAELKSTPSPPIRRWTVLTWYTVRLTVMRQTSLKIGLSMSVFNSRTRPFCDKPYSEMLDRTAMIGP